MELAVIAMKKTMMFYLIFISGILIVLLLCILFAKFRNTGKQSAPLYAVAISVMLLIYILTTFVPFLKDYFNNAIVKQTGVYTNVIGNDSKSPSSTWGMYSVTLESEGEIKKLTTAPFQQDVFVKGKYEVNAYFMASSKTLLYIELLGQYE